MDLNALPEGYQLLWYKIEATIGQGGFGITYRANDTNLNQTVAVKEFYPSDLASRTSDSSVHPSSSRNIDDFNWGLSRFTYEAQTLAQFKHPNIVGVYSVFEANQTAYMVMEYIKGQSISEAIKAGLLEGEDACLNLLFDIMGGLQLIHDSGFIHRDIKPDNICLTEDGVPVLLDFGSARQALGAKTRALTSVVSPGYAPFEQYSTQSNGGKQGPWTDIYSLAATIYHVIAKQGPLDVLDRVNAVLVGNKDPLVPASEMGRSSYSPAFLEAIDRALAVQPQDRPQSLVEWKQILPDPQMESDKTVLRPAVRTPRRTKAPPAARPSEAPARKRRWLWPSVAALSVVLLIGIGVALFPGGEIESEKPESLFEKTEQKEQPAKVAQLLADAEIDAREGRLSRPAGRNALERYREVLKIAPDNAAAKQGIELVMGRYVEAAEGALAEERFEQAEQYLDTAAGILPDAPAVQDIRQRLAQARETMLTRQYDEQIQRELAAAERDFRAGRLDSPPGENALERYRKVLVLEPDNAAAAQGLERIMTNYVALADAALGNKDFAGAAQHLDSAAEVFPGAPAVLASRQRLAEAQQAKADREEAGRKRQDDIRRQLAAAQTDQQGRRLAQAVEGYRSVLALDAENAPAKQGLDLIANLYVAQADAAVERGQFAEAERSLQAASRTAPGLAALAASRERLTSAQLGVQQAAEQRARTQREIDKLLTTAQSDELQRRLAEAEQGYRRVLALELANTPAKQGLERIAIFYVAQADTAVKRGRFADAERRLAAASQAAPGLAAITASRGRLRSAQQGAQQAADQRARTQREFDKLLTAAQSDEQRRRLAEAEQGYRSVLALDSGNASAKRGLERIAALYVAQADAAVKRGRFADAQRSLQAASKAAPGLAIIAASRGRLATEQKATAQKATEQNKRLADEQRRREQADAKRRAAEKAENDNRRRIERLLAAADRDIAALRLSSPAGNNALARIQAVEKIDPGNKGAQLRRERIVDQYIELAERSRSSNAFGKAQGHLERANRILPNAPIIVAARRSLEKSKSAYEADRARIAKALEQKPQESQSAPAVAGAETLEPPEVSAEAPGPLRIAVFPFATGGSSFESAADAEQSLENVAHEYIQSNTSLLLAYSFYQPGNGELKIVSPTSFWSKDFIRKTPDDKRIFEQAGAFDVDAVLTYFFKMQGGRYSTNYEVEAYLYDTKRRRVYAKNGNQGNIRAITADLFSEFLQ